MILKTVICLFKCFVVCTMLFIVSCDKNPDEVHVPYLVHFHGRITVGCNNQIPVPNSQIAFHRLWDNGISRSDFLGHATTDDDGYYEFTAEVKQDGYFKRYILNDYGSSDLLERTYACHEETDSDTKDVELNGLAGAGKAYGFHIRNVSPFDNADILNELVVWISPSNSSEQPIITNLAGTTIDTTIYRFIHPILSGNYEYSYTKNGVLTVVPLDTLPYPNCLDTAIVEIFY